MSVGLEKRWVMAVAFVAVAITSVPYIMAASAAPQTFTGFLIGVEDGNSYIAKMLAGAYGDWLFNSPYTAMPQSGALVYLPYLLLGKALGPGAGHFDFVVAFHLFRVGSLVFLCFASYDFLSYFVSELKLKLLGLLVILLGGGLGWLVAFLQLSPLFGSIPLDFYSPETFGFLAGFTLPHIALARALMLWALLSFLRRSHDPWKTGLVWLLMAATHLVTAMLALGLLCLHVAYRSVKTREFKHLEISPVFVPTFAVSVVLIPNLWFFAQDDYLKIWASQNQILSPNPVHYLIAYGWLIPFAFSGLKEVYNKNKNAGEFAALWLIALPLLLYFPFGLQCRLAEGVWVLLVALALVSFDRGDWRFKRKDLWLFAVSFPSTLVLLLGALQLSSNQEPPVFRPRDEVEVFEDLRSMGTPKDVVLSSYETGNALPAWAPMRVLVGHGPEGTDQARLQSRIESFFQGRTTDDARLEFLLEHNVRFVFWGPVEDGYGSWVPSTAGFLTLVSENGMYSLFEVSDEAIE